MLKLERLGQSNTLIVRLPRRRFDRAMLRACLYSALLHALVFGVIRVKFPDVHDTPVVYAPIEVGIESEDSPQAVAEAGDFTASAKMLPPLPPIKKILLQALKNGIPQDIHASSETLIPTLSIEYDPLKQESRHIFADERIYPLRLHLSSKLAKYPLLDDGSLLFRKKSTLDNRVPPIAAHSPYVVAYYVTVSGASGKIITCTKKKTCSDKKLQKYADILLEHIRFVPCNKEVLRGKIRFTFACAGNGIDQYLEP